MADSTKGASDNERLISAARDDNVELLQEIFEEDDFDINYKDGQGNTPLHYAALQGSTEVLEYILSHENCDVDPVNSILYSTPLHLAVLLDDPRLRRYVVESLLEAGADTTIKDKNRSTALELVPHDDAETRELFRKAEAANAVALDDIASDSEGDGEGSDEGSDDDD